MLVLLVQKLFRFLRRPSVLVLILLVSLAYCLIHLLSIGSTPTVVHDPDVAPPDDIDPLLILHQSDYPLQSDSNDTGQSLGPLSCRNSVQGKLLIADDRGYVCERADVGLSGCCNTTAASSHQHWCESCDNDCCSVYEHCVSCCLHPDKKPLLHSVLAKAPSRFRLLLASVTDQFELCLTKCRTDSQSVLHQNVYRNAQIKYCFGQSPPPLERTE